MAKLKVVGRLGATNPRKDYLSFGVAEPSYKDKNNNYVTPWFNFLVKLDSATAKFLTANAAKIDVVEVEATERQVTKDGKTEYYHNVNSVNIITWKKADNGNDNPGAESSVAEPTVEGTDTPPWAN